MGTLEERLDKAEEIILKRSFRHNSGFEDAYYIFDYDAAKELYIRERINFLIKKSRSSDIKIVVFDLYAVSRIKRHPESLLSFIYGLFSLLIYVFICSSDL